MNADGRVPERDRAEVALEKVTQYLLNVRHIDGHGKAEFLISHGFSPDQPLHLVSALLTHVRENECREIKHTPFGVKYVVDGPLKSPDGRTPFIRSVWTIEPPATHPRLVTAFPAPRPNAA